MNLQETIEVLEIRAGAEAEVPLLKTRGIRLKEIIPKYQKACRAGWKPTEGMQAKAPPGWEGTVKKMKDHPEIDNPYALTNWMEEQGYKPGGKKK